MMFHRQEEYEKILEQYVEAYIAYRECMSDEMVVTEKEATKALNDLLDTSKALGTFKEEVYGDANRSFPNMDAYFQKSDGEYHDFAYRTYKAVYEAGQAHKEQEWRIFSLVRIGELLRNYYLQFG